MGPQANSWVVESFPTLSQETPECCPLRVAKGRGFRFGGLGFGASRSLTGLKIWGLWASGFRVGGFRVLGLSRRDFGGYIRGVKGLWVSMYLRM